MPPARTIPSNEEPKLFRTKINFARLLNPFTFPVPYDNYPENLAKYGDKVELIPMDCSKIRDTVLNLLKDLPDLAQCVRD
jgi:hypothetical protein